MKTRVSCSMWMPACGRAADDAGSAIDDVDAVARHDGDGRTHAVGFGIRRAGAQQDDARVLRRCARRRSKRRPAVQDAPGHCRLEAMPYVLRITALACAAVLAGPGRRQSTDRRGEVRRMAAAVRRQELRRVGRPHEEGAADNGFTIEDGCIKSLPHQTNSNQDLFTTGDVPRFRNGVRLEDFSGREQRREVSHTGPRDAGRRRSPGRSSRTW